MNLSFKTKLLFFVLFLGLFAGGIFWYVNRQKTPPGVLILHGRVEGKEINLGTKIQGRVIKLYKRESDPVKKGDLLAELRPDEYFAQLQAAQNEVRSAEETILMAESYLVKSQSRVEQAKRDLERYKKLYQEGLVSKRDLEVAELEYKTALSELKVNQRYINQAKAKYLSALQKVKEIEVAYKETKIYAPSDGVILSRVAEEGEVVNPGQVIYTMVNLQNLYIKVYIPEPEVGKVKLGQPARVYVDAYPNRYFNGTLTRVYEKAEFTPKNVETKEERVKLVFGAEVSVENPEGLLKPGMPADVVIKTDPKAEWVKP
ncbi:MAG: Secretion protein HlyD family protein [Thermodesulfobacterium sp. 37_54]|jgi:HlyD family secretion protein|uniref:Secretion protein HylD n=1 Tax=Thermodesulfobacterium commune DSM 2178 TaxID=289377 RepID=A0A075WU37_9BACT|nr:efflux RND transporter periplasmic adaptor subunit [Thermodesulfobacterium commune]KUJ97455.1 MAG: Secretion protein HlyD family protein [Thermodesulfobacterium sp. 37_54]AIH04401.1 secretion protein HylD [Thermodesulfobacterium commune DSM 2178]KUK18879.1 MAG: Secretion protein HlyD family protein [Thermodesulfobacterium commune]HCE80519.1 efflux RND transporter periplasmic adaptor subunit [Thermodesulfobacterium commune]HCP09835.1 efflux RND transporter periplasmic adaptor subunit [Thermo